MIKRSILLLILSVILSTPVYAGVLFFQDFDSNPLGQFPPGWTEKPDTSGINWDAIFTVTADPDPARTGRSVKYTDTSGFAAYSPYREFSPQTAGLLVEFDMMKVVGGAFNIYVHDGNLNGANIYFRDSNIAVYAGAYPDTLFIETISYSLDQWYHFALDIDIAAEQYDVYIDDTLRLSDVAFRIVPPFTQAGPLSQFSMGGNTNAAYTGYVDNVYVATAGSAVPEPTTLLLLATGILALPFLKRKS